MKTISKEAQETIKILEENIKQTENVCVICNKKRGTPISRKHICNECITKRAYEIYSETGNNNAEENWQMAENELEMEDLVDCGIVY